MRRLPAGLRGREGLGPVGLQASLGDLGDEFVGNWLGVRELKIALGTCIARNLGLNQSVCDWWKQAEMLLEGRVVNNDAALEHRWHAIADALLSSRDRLQDGAAYCDKDRLNLGWKRLNVLIYGVRSAVHEFSPVRVGISRARHEYTACCVRRARRTGEGSQTPRVLNEPGKP